MSKREEKKDKTTIIVENIKEILRVKNMQMSYLEEKTGSCTGYFARAKQNNVDIGVGKVEQVCKVLGVKIENVIFEDGWKEVELEATKERLYGGK